MHKGRLQLYFALVGFFSVANECCAAILSPSTRVRPNCAESSGLIARSASNIELAGARAPNIGTTCSVNGATGEPDGEEKEDGRTGGEGTAGDAEEEEAAGTTGEGIAADEEEEEAGGATEGSGTRTPGDGRWGGMLVSAVREELPSTTMVVAGDGAGFSGDLAGDGAGFSSTSILAGDGVGLSYSAYASRFVAPRAESLGSLAGASGRGAVDEEEDEEEEEEDDAAAAALAGKGGANADDDDEADEKEANADELEDDDDDEAAGGANAKSASSTTSETSASSAYAMSSSRWDTGSLPSASQSSSAAQSPSPSGCSLGATRRTWSKWRASVSIPPSRTSALTTGPWMTISMPIDSISLITKECNTE